jgi:hypothetical protein
MKYYGTIGFWKKDVEIRPGVTRPQIVPREYTGDILDNRQRWVPTEFQNDNLTINIRLSIIGDLYLNENISSIKYATYMKEKWKVKSIDTTKYPRVILELGEVYNGVDTR